MVEKIPRSLIRWIALFGLLSFSAGMYIDWAHPEWLEKRAVTTNLLSGAIGFSAVAVTVAYGFERYIRSHQWLQYRAEADACAAAAYEGMAQLKARAEALNSGGSEMSVGEVHDALQEVSRLLARIEEIAGTEHGRVQLSTADQGMMRNLLAIPTAAHARRSFGARNVPGLLAYLNRRMLSLEITRAHIRTLPAKHVALP